MKKLFILYDGRAKSGDTDRASIYVTADSEKEAREDGQEPAWNDGVWYEYDRVPAERGAGGMLKNERPRFDIPPNSL